MSETEWLMATEPQAMLRFLEGSGAATDRRLRLFACGCCRRIWEVMTDRRSREAVEVAERFAEGTLDWQEMRAAYENACDAEYDRASGHDATDSAASSGGVAAAYAAGNLASIGYVISSAGEAVEESLWAEESAAQAAALRDIFGNPFRPLSPLAPPLLGWNNGLLRQLAHAAYEHRELPSGHLDRSRLAILADGLLDAGCEDGELIGHLREAGPHYLGCVAVDAVLGRT